MNKFKTILFTLTLVFLSTANAIELGRLTVNSHLNEPLDAKFTLGHIAADNLGDIILSLADHKTYQSMGLEKPYFLSNLKFKITAGPGEQHIVQISTQKRIREPILDILVKVTEKQSSLTRLYTLMLDPREISTIEQVESSPVALIPVVKNSTTQASKSAPTETQSQPVGASSKQIRVGNDSISIIAQNSPLHKKYSVYQIMRAFYQINTSAFYKGNINHVVSGSLLVVPDEKAVAEVSRQKSVNFVYAASKNYPFAKETVIQEQPVVKANGKKQTINQLLTEEKAVVAKVTPVAKTELPNESRQLISRNMFNDIKSWRSVSEEFKSLSSVVQNQNDALKIQSAVLQQINAQLQQKNQQIELINLRLEALELAAGSASNGQQQFVQTANRAEPLSQQGIAINELDRIKLRLEALEQQPLIEETATELQPGSAEFVPPIAKIKVDTIEQPALFNQPLIWGLLLVGIVLLMFLWREVVWRSRLKSVSTIINNVPEAQLPVKSGNEIEEIELQGVVTEDGVEETVAKEIEADSELNEIVQPESNLQVADQKFEEAVSNAREFELDSTLNVDEMDLDNESRKEALYAEIDVLIAYQLYDAAFELLATARETIHDDSFLDIRELEILAYTKNVNLFFPKFEKQKAELSAAHPEQWVKIVDLYDQLNAEYLADSNVLRMNSH